MQNTTLVNAVQIDTPSAAFSAAKTTLQTSTAALQVHLKITNGSGANQNAKNRVKCFIAISPFSMTAAAATKALRQQAVEVSVPSFAPDGTEIAASSDVLPVLGQYCYTWFEIPAFVPEEPTLDAVLVELN